MKDNIINMPIKTDTPKFADFVKNQRESVAIRSAIEDEKRELKKQRYIFSFGLAFFIFMLIMCAVALKMVEYSTDSVTVMLVSIIDILIFSLNLFVSYKKIAEIKGKLTSNQSDLDKIEQDLWQVGKDWKRVR